MIEFFVKRPITTIMFVSVFVVLGLVSYANLQVERTPKIDFPIVTISVIYPGATPLDVETLAISKIEDAVSEISEIDKIRSRSYDSFGYVFVEFLLSADVNVKLIEVKDKVEAILNDLPEGIEKPIVEKYDPLMSPVMDLVLSGDEIDGRTLHEYADKTLKDKFLSIEGVARVGVYGGKERQINVSLDPMLMKERYITVPEVISALRRRNINIPAGDLEKASRAFSVRFIGEFGSPDEIADVMLTSIDGKTFPLRDIGTIEDGFKKVESIARYNGRDAVGLSLMQVSDGNAVKIAGQVANRLDEFREALPAGMQLDIATDNTTYLISETKNTEMNILIGILLTVAILYLFTGKFKITFIAVIVIPTSLISTFALMNASGFSINFITLLAIATSMGTLIANAIVIIENVLVHLEKKESVMSAVIGGTKEVAGAVFASTGTNVVVFVPIALMGGLAGQFMKAFGLTVVYATLFSLLASFTLTPMLCAVFLGKSRSASAGKEKKENVFIKPFRFIVRQTDRMVEFLKKEYKPIFKAMFRYPKATVFLVVVLFVSLGFITPYIDNNFMPTSDEDMVGIQVIMPQGSTIERTLDVVKEIEAHLDEVPEKASYMVNIGKDGVERASIVMDLVPLGERQRSDLDIIDSLMPAMTAIADAEVILARPRRTGGIEGADISIDLYGLDYDRMIALSGQLQAAMEETGYFRSANSSYKFPKTEVKFIPKQEKLVEYGLSAAYVGSTLRSSIYGDDSNIYKEAGEEYDIYIKLDERYLQTIDDIEEISVLSAKGLVSVAELGEIRQAKTVPAIWRRDKNRIIRLDGYLAKGSSGYVRQVLDEEFKKIDFPQGYRYAYSGDSELQEEAIGEIVKAFILAVILTYMLLCAILDSLKYPVPILLTVPTSFIGVLYTLFFFGQSINMASMLTMVMLVGLVVNNSILLLDYAMMKIKEGVPVVEALWLGASVKFRAILMTSIAIIFGILPQLWSNDAAKQSMGQVMFGGMVASIVFTFVFVPVVFWYLENLRRKPKAS